MMFINNIYDTLREGQQFAMRVEGLEEFNAILNVYQGKLIVIQIAQSGNAILVLFEKVRVVG